MKIQILTSLIVGISFITILCSCDLKTSVAINSDSKLEKPPEIPEAFTEESCQIIRNAYFQIIRHNETNKRYIVVDRKAIEEIK